VVGVLTIVALLLTGTRLLVGPLPAEDREEVLALSERFALALATYDHEDLEGQAEEIRGMSTGDFLEEYEATFGSEAFGDAMRQTRSNASATVTEGPWLASLEEMSARTLTVVEQSIQAEELDESDVRGLQVELTVTRTSEGWRVDGVEIH
jgi:Mce-associated membrane protein